MPLIGRKKTAFAVVGIIIAFLIGGSMVPNFLKPANLLNVVRQCSIIVICAVGIAPVIISRGIDLSVGGNVTFCGMLTGFLLLRGVPVLLAVLAALLTGILIGTVSGLLHAYLEVPAFIATLVVGQITQGSSFLLNNGRSFGGFPESYVFIGNGALLGVPVSNYIMVLFVILGVLLTRKLPIGTHIYGLGGNETVLKNAGVNTAHIKWFVFALSGFCAAAAGVVLAAQLDTAHPTQGEPYQLDAIAACIIGGVSMSGGEGNILLVMVGALVIGSIRNILNLLAVHSFYQNILVGVIIITVVAVSMATRQHRTRKTAQFAPGKA
ncbi:MAG: ABC transporter permease [Christensenellales bacterium]|jgi:ribose/xylose/arabinose/galactoside ABC-type transport system permease subunit